MFYKNDWPEARDKFISWWNHENTGRPLFKLIAKRDAVPEGLVPEKAFETPDAAYLDVDELCKRYENFCKSHIFMAEAFPAIDLNLGPGSLALYLGTEPIFRPDTVWFKEWVEEGWQNAGTFTFDPTNQWFVKHLEIIRRAQELAGGRYWVNIPDIVENVDILAAMRGPQDFCYDLIDEPDLMKDYVGQLDRLYMDYYNAFYDIVKQPDGASTYTAFGIWGPGKTAKIQCDFCALMNPSQFKEFVLESLRKQTECIDHTIYHLDGPDAVRHLDALLTLDQLNVIQWTHGAGKPDGLWEGWYEPIYEKVLSAGKSLLLFVTDGDVDRWIGGIDKLVNRFGTHGLFLQFDRTVKEEDAKRIMTYAEKWER